MTVNQPADRQRILETGGRILSEQSFSRVTLAYVADCVNLSVSDLEDMGLPTMHTLGCAILDYERDSMRRVQSRVLGQIRDPRRRILHSFTSVGDLLAFDTIVRAGVRLASQARDHFPERRLDPFRTWEGFVTTSIVEARRQRRIRQDVGIDAIAELIVAVGMGVKDRLILHSNWTEAPKLLGEAIGNTLRLVTVEDT